MISFYIYKFQVNWIVDYIVTPNKTAGWILIKLYQFVQLNSEQNTQFLEELPKSSSRKPMALFPNSGV